MKTKIFSAISIIGMMTFFSCAKEEEPKTKFLDAYVAKLKESKPNVFSDKTFTPNKDTDLLMVIDVQNDFTGKTNTAPVKGRFNVEEGEEITPSVSRLINLFGKNGVPIFASRDFHPNDHVSFKTVGGIFPEHCVMGSEGNELTVDVKEALIDNQKLVTILFKGHHPRIDSFGALEYSDWNTAKDRLSNGCNPKTQSCMEDKMTFTGGFKIEPHDKHIFHPIKGQGWTNEDSINENPVEATFLEHLENKCSTSWNTDSERFKQDNCKLKPVTIPDNVKNVFVVGLAGDFCVHDTLKNAAALAKKAGKEINLYLIVDNTRYGWSQDEKVGTFKFDGGAFYNDPAKIAAEYEESNVKLIKAAQITGF